jgi:hypothetical protein
MGRERFTIVMEEMTVSVFKVYIQKVDKFLSDYTASCP